MGSFSFRVLLYNPGIRPYYVRMNRLLKALTPLLALVFVVQIVLNIRYMTASPFVTAPKSLSSPRSFHFAFFIPEADYSFFRELKNGAIDAAQVMDCSISFHPIDLDPQSLAMARYSGVDGVAVYPYKEDESILTGLKRIYEAGIPVVQMENMPLVEPKTVFIGTNSFDFGKAIGRLSLGAEHGQLRVALVYSDKTPGLVTDSSLIEMGIKTTLGSRLSILRSFRTRTNPLDADRLAYELVRGRDSFNLLVFTDTSDTIVAAQAIVDMNAVGALQVIGFGDDQAIRRYIEKDVIMGSIVRDPYRIGFNAVRALAEIKKNGNTSSFVDTGIRILDKQSLAQGGYGGGK